MDLWDCREPGEGAKGVACSSVSGTEVLVGSLWFSPATPLLPHPKVLVGRGPQALVFLAWDERIWAEGLVLAGWGWTWEQAVCLSQHWVPAWLPNLTPQPLSSLLSTPEKGRCTQADTC